MKLLEHEAKTILKAAGVPVPRGTVITPQTTPELTLPVVLKSQVPIGGRGKLGGVVVVEEAAELESVINRLFALDIRGYTPTTLLAEEKLAIHNEYYFSIVINKATANIELVAHRNGGVEVEANDHASFLHFPLTTNNAEAAGEQLAEYLDLPGQSFVLQDLVENTYNCFVQNDATLLEINPLVLTADNKIMAGDCKMELDDAAAFRHADWQFEDTPRDTNFVTLDHDGTIATIANGAGLAMATVDAVAAAGMTPANFLDVGGGANTASVLTAFERIITYPNVQAIVINIFAGITRCDEVARAIIAARQQIDDLPPLFIRLAGTNFEEAVTLLTAENITTLASLEECLAAAKEVNHA
ncbi:MAG TPA: ATP-grasp domain-containing protein [Candidatus Saccharimonadales bacterium]|nr:ATP-grasp domain-containing protein [Candidatus Saccharimonadales bacterium]